MMLRRNRQKLIQPLLEPLRITRPKLVLQKHARRIHPHRLRQPELFIVQRRIERRRLKHLQLIDRVRRNVIRAHKPRLMVIPRIRLRLCPPVPRPLRPRRTRQQRNQRKRKPYNPPLLPTRHPRTPNTPELTTHNLERKTHNGKRRTDNPRPLLHVIIRSFPRNHHIMHMALPETRIRNPNKLRVRLQLLNRRAPEIPHAGP